MSDQAPTDAKLRDLQSTERNRQRYQAGSGLRKVPNTGAIFEQIEKNITDRDEDPRTFGCFVCQDTGFVLELKPSPLKYQATIGTYCAACQDPGFATLEDADLAALRAIPWTIDGDLGKDRLRYRQHDEPTQWIYPDGKRCEYDGQRYKQLPEIPTSLYQALFDEARRMKRIGTPELVKQSR